MKELSRVSLQDSSGAVLSFVVEANGDFFKLTAQYRASEGAETQNSDFWSFTALERAEKARDMKIQEAMEMGWTSEST